MHMSTTAPFRTRNVQNNDAGGSEDPSRTIPTSSSSASSISSSSFPFDHVVITFPDEAAAAAAAQGPLVALAAAHGIVMHATTDPFGARVGSGGGTLSAVEALCHWRRRWQQDGTKKSPNGNGDDHEEAEDEENLFSDHASFLASVRVLIVHAGGESSRCPTQMVLGKAFTSLPTRTRRRRQVERTDNTSTQQQAGVPRDDDNDVTTTTITTPLGLWLDLCHDLFQNTLPVGSLVVVASDTLLDLPSVLSSQPSSCIDWSTAEGVVGVAVPAPLTTATNHGVYLLAESSEATSRNDVHMAPCRQVLQKPSLEMLANHIVSKDDETNNSNHNNNDVAWIDTGVLVFLPRAAAALVQLASGPLARCTRTGLEHAFQQQKQQQQQQESKASLAAFSREKALSVDVYTHVLQALQLYGGGDDDDHEDRNDNQRMARYRQAHTDTLGEVVTQALWEALSPHGLNILVVPEGRFLHLGTTRELLDFMVQACDTEDNRSSSKEPSQNREALCRCFGRHIGMVRRARAVSLGIYVHPTVTLADTWLACASPSAHDKKASDDDAWRATSVGTGTVLEHCWIETQHVLQIGENCLVSGLRTVKNKPRDHLTIPKGLVVQQVLVAPVAPSASTCFVYMVLGVTDNIKDSAMLYNAPLSDVLQFVGLEEHDLWDDDCSKRNLWTARLHPMIVPDDEDFWWPDLFSWLVDFTSGSACLHPESLARYRSSRRLSLAEIRNGGDASAEFAYRAKLTHDIQETKQAHIQAQATILCERRHDALDLAYIVNACVAGIFGQDLVQAIDMLQGVVKTSLGQQKYDICGRACMILGSLWDDLAQCVSECMPSEASNTMDRVMLKTECSTLVSRCFDKGEPQVTAFLELFLISRRVVTSEQRPFGTIFQVLADAFQELAQAMTAKCVRVSSSSFYSSRDQGSPLYDKWVLASAPARIDLAGGWSDTPPICFEYGASVTGVAVAVNGMKPMACRCRIVTGARGVYLRSELRESPSAKLVSLRETEVTLLEELRDYKDPSSDGALLKCSLLCLGLVSPDELQSKGGDLQTLIDTFCQSSQSVRLEIVVTSMLPQGSGLGTSSILGGCVLATVGRCVGVAVATENIVESVLLLEQLLTTGGGFQDQVNGLIGGFKKVSCRPQQFPFTLQVEQLAVTQEFVKDLNRHLLLVFTGKTRLAKNILSNVLSRWSKRTFEIVTTVFKLVQGSDACEEAIVEAADLDAVAASLSDYWSLKKTMAGCADSGVDNCVEPVVVQSCLQKLTKDGLIRGGSLCGAGGGGFLALITAENVAASDASSRLQDAVVAIQGTEDFVWYDCRVCNEGLSIQILDDDTDLPVDVFHPSWLHVDD